MFRNLPIEQISIDREARQRRELLAIDELAASISQIGLINPIVIDEHFNLVAGERRLEACRTLGWDSIPTQTRDDLDEYTAQLLEFEENIKRKELPWRDECQAVYNYHNLRLEHDPEHTAVMTATELSMSVTSVHERINIIKELQSGNELVAKADKFSVARNIVERASERRAAAELESITQTIIGKPHASDDGGTDEIVPVEDRPDVPIINADFHEWAPVYDGPRFNFIHCDFPYGIKADKHHQGAAKYYRGYEDSPDVYWALIATLGENLERICADSAHLIFWYSMDFHHETKLALQQMGWRVNPFPLVWFKSDNTGILPDPSRGPRRVYETAFFASRGDRKIVQAVGNCYPASVTKTTHMSQKASSMLKHFFRMPVDQHTWMLDPTCGSGSAIQAAKALGANTVLGLEKDPEFHALAVEEWRKNDGQLSLPEV